MSGKDLQPCVGVAGVGVHHPCCQLGKFSDMSDQQRVGKSLLHAHIQGISDKIGAFDRAVCHLRQRMKIAFAADGLPA